MNKYLIIAIIIVIALISFGFWSLNIKNNNTDNPPVASSTQNLSQVPTATTTPPFKALGDMVKKDSVWYFTAKSGAKTNVSLVKEGTYKLKFNDISVCQSTSVKAIKCSDFKFATSSYSNSIGVVGTQTGDEVLVIKLTIIQ